MYEEITFFTTTSAFSGKVHTELAGIPRKFPDASFINYFLSGNCSVKILSLKSVLLYQLGRALLCDSKADEVSFLNFLDLAANEARAVYTTDNKRIVDWCKIPLRKRQQKPQKASQILYISALPKAMPILGQAKAGADPSALSQAFVNRLNQSRSNLKAKLINNQMFCSQQTLSVDAQLWLEFEIETQKAGWLTFCLPNQSIDRWLQHLRSQSLNQSQTNDATYPFVSSATQPQYGLQPFATKAGPSNQLASYPTKGVVSDDSTALLLWQAQYAHACCARLERDYLDKDYLDKAKIDRAKLDRPKLDRANFAKALDRATRNATSRERPLLWDVDRISKQVCGESYQDKPCQNEPCQPPLAAHLLVRTLVDTSDSLFWIPYRWPTQQYLLLLKLVKPLCQAFEQFYRVCLCGSQQPYVETKPSATEYKMQQQILVSATKNVLKCLLEEYLGEKAPEQI